MTDDTHDWLARRFEAERPHLRAVAYRMLGSLVEADDAVQESWLHLSRSGAGGVENLGGWLTTVVARVCLDMLRSRKSRREDLFGDQPPEPLLNRAGETDPEYETLLADAMGLALLVVLDTLNPAERLAFVLHDLFDVPFDEIAPIVGRSPTAARQLASRARRRVQGKGAEAEAEAGAEADSARQRAVVAAFLAASRSGDFAGLLALLDPEVVCRADSAVIAVGAPSEVRGATAVAQHFSGRAQDARLTLINGAAGAVWSRGGRPRVVFSFTVADGKVVAIEMIADPARLGQFELTPLEDA